MAKSKQQSKSVSFRVPEPLASTLEREASSHGLSAGKQALSIVVAHLQDEERGTYLREVRELKADVHHLRNQLKAALESILLNVAKVERDQVIRHVSSIFQ